MLSEKGFIRLKVEHFSQFKTYRVSEVTMIQKLPWTLYTRKWNDGTSGKAWLGCYVQCNMEGSNSEWNCVADLIIRVVTQREGKLDLNGTKLKHTFSAKQNNWGFNKMILFEELMKPENGFYDVENDAIIVEADLWAEAPNGLNSGASFADRLLYLLNSGRDANVHFLVGINDSEKEKFAAHKGILASLSDVFDRMFDFDTNCGFSDKMIEVTDVKPDAFRVMLNFIYTMKFDGLNQENVFDVLHAADKYNIIDLIDACAGFPKLDANNVLFVLSKALHYEVKVLICRCWKYIELHACAVLESDKFVEIDQALLCDLISRQKQLVIPYKKEITLCNAALRWVDAQCYKNNMEISRDNRRKMLGSALFKFHIPVLDNDQFDSTIDSYPVLAKILTSEEIVRVDAYQVINQMLNRVSSPPNMEPAKDK